MRKFHKTFTESLPTFLALGLILPAYSRDGIPTLTAGASYNSGREFLRIITPDDPNIRYVGHWDHWDGSDLAKQAITVNSGSRILCGFTGHTIRGLFRTKGITNPAEIYVSVDRSRPILFTLDSDVENLSVSVLKGDRHTLQIAVKDVDERANR